jgi:hypothetical protein
MKKKIIRYVIAISIFILLFSLFLMNQLNILEKGGSLGHISSSAFSKIEIGMTKDQVESLIGSNNIVKKQNAAGDFWECGYTSGLTETGPSPKAYVIWFKANKVETKRKPIK